MNSVILRRTRGATIALFLVTGVGLSVWVVSIPAVEAATGISHAVLGTLLLLLGLGSVVGMLVTGRIIDRIGSRRAAMGAAVLLAVGTVSPALAVEPWGLGAALFLLGLGQGSMDVSMNDQAVLVERESGKPIMSSFHAFFSIGGAVGAVIGVVTQTLRLPFQVTLIGGAVIVAVACAVSVPLLFRQADATLDGEVGVPGERVVDGQQTPKIWALGALAFLLMLAEGTANDWSALHAVRELSVPEAAGSLAFATFAVAMTVGRFSADSISARFGPVAVVRFGSLLAMLGISTVILAGWYPATLAGWALFGLGLAGTLPQIFTAAGNLGGPAPGFTLARVVGAGYVGLLAGPALVGWVSSAAGLGGALGIAVACCAFGAVFAGKVAKKTQN